MPNSRYIFLEARSWLDTPYRHHGREKGVAVDCIGLAIGVGDAVLNTHFYDLFDYSAHPKDGKLEAEIGKLLIAAPGQVPAKQRGAPVNLVPGEVITLAMKDNGEATHLAIIGEFEGRLTMIHAFLKHEKVVEHTLTDWWIKRICMVYRYPGVDYD